jgi:chromosome partitioning protein
MKTIAVLSRKGGSGKTTVSLSLALAARQAGLKVVVADIDPLHSAGEILGRRTEAASLLFETTAAKLFILQDVCAKNHCDLLIVDTPTAPEGDVILAINSADLCLAVARPTVLDVAAVKTSVELVQRMRGSGLVVLNQCPPARNGIESAFVERAREMLEHEGMPTARSLMRSRVAYQHAFAQQQGVTEWDAASDAATDVLRLLAEVSDALLLPCASDGLARMARDVGRQPLGLH